MLAAMAGLHVVRDSMFSEVAIRIRTLPSISMRSSPEKRRKCSNPWSREERWGCGFSEVAGSLADVRVGLIANRQLRRTDSQSGRSRVLPSSTCNRGNAQLSGGGRAPEGTVFAPFLRHSHGRAVRGTGAHAGIARCETSVCQPKVISRVSEWALLFPVQRALPGDGDGASDGAPMHG
jgi:hypothetical protein